MRLSKVLAMGTATASLILIVAAPSHAQKSKTIQNQRQQTTVKPVAMKPYVRPVAPTVRDHRKAANPAVKPSGEKRKSSTCVQSLVGGPSVCSGGKVLAGPIKPPQTIFRETQSKIKKVGKAAKSVAKKLNPFD